MDPTHTSVYDGWRRSSPWSIATEGMQEKNCSTTVVEAFRRPCTPCPLMPRRMKFTIYFYRITPISKLHLGTYLLFNRSNKNLRSHYRHTVQGTSHSTSWHTKALPLKSDGSKVSCIHYANSLHGKLGDEMEGRFNQRLPKNLQEAFERAINFEPRILPKQRIHTKKVNEVNHIDISRITTQITRRTKITSIAIPTALTTRRTAPTMATTPPTETSGTTRVTTQSYHQT